MSLFFGILILTSCTSIKNIEPTEIIIIDASSYRYDLLKGIYTVFLTNKSTINVNFTLSILEKQAIFKFYNKLRLVEFKNSIEIQDNCTVMPKSYTLLSIKSQHGQSEIKIDESCNNFSYDNLKKANRVKDFIKFVKNIIDKKPEIKNAPISDILYL